jgi:hypothetical protein
VRQDWDLPILIAENSIPRHFKLRETELEIDSFKIRQIITAVGHIVVLPVEVSKPGIAC